MGLGGCQQLGTLGFQNLLGTTPVHIYMLADRHITEPALFVLVWSEDPELILDLGHQIHLCVGHA